MTDSAGANLLISALRSGSPRNVLAAENELGLAARFEDLDHLISQVLEAAFSGQALAEITHKNRGSQPDAVRLAGLDSAARTVLDRHFDLAAQEATGAWFLPQEASLRAGTANLPTYVLGGNPFAVNAARDGNVKVSLRENPDALAIWALIIPLLETLLAPVELRSSTAKTKPAEQQVNAWTGIAETYAHLELDVGDVVSQMSYGGGWSQLRIGEQRELVSQLVRRLAGALTPDTAKLWRAHLALQLSGGYFKKAKAGPPLARAVLTKALQPAFSTAFAGDWIAMLDYLGAQANAAEQITTALPEPRLYTGATDKAVQVAAESGLPVDEVQRIVASFLGQHPGVSPIEERVQAMRQWWNEYDAIWSRQASGMPSLWGLVDEGLFVLDNPRAPAPYLYRQVLTPELTATVDQLWDGVTIPKWPERIVSEFHPHRQMADSLGPAVKFWQGIALTCWYVCEGPASRTTLGALGQYHGKDVAALRDIGFPIDTQLFADLAKAESQLGPPQRIESQRDVQSRGNVELTMTISIGTRRDGFELLRDIVTRHRRTWATTHLEGYLEHRWDSELRAVAHEHSRRVAAKGKAPTIKQFAGFAAPAANHWFGGDLAALYATLGEVTPATPERIDLLPGDPYAFVHSVWTALGGQHLPEDASWKDRPAFDHQWQIGKLASRSLHYVQLSEALDRPPTPKEFGANRITWDTFGGEERGWQRYVEIVEQSRTNASEAPPTAPPPAPPPEQRSPPQTAPSPAAEPKTRTAGWRRFLGKD